MRHWSRLSSVQVMDCHLFEATPLPESMLNDYKWTPTNKFQWNFAWHSTCSYKKMHFEMSAKQHPFCSSLKVFNPARWVLTVRSRGNRRKRWRGAPSSLHCRRSRCQLHAPPERLPYPCCRLYMPENKQNIIWVVVYTCLKTNKT